MSDIVTFALVATGLWILGWDTWLDTWVTGMVGMWWVLIPVAAYVQGRHTAPMLVFVVRVVGMMGLWAAVWVGAYRYTCLRTASIATIAWMRVVFVMHCVWLNWDSYITSAYALEYEMDVAKQE